MLGSSRLTLFGPLDSLHALDVISNAASNNRPGIRASNRDTRISVNFMIGILANSKRH
jgi:hypothetical protein